MEGVHQLAGPGLATGGEARGDVHREHLDVHAALPQPREGDMPLGGTLVEPPAPGLQVEDRIAVQINDHGRHVNLQRCGRD